MYGFKNWKPLEASKTFLDLEKFRKTNLQMDNKFKKCLELRKTTFVTKKIVFQLHLKTVMPPLKNDQYHIFHFDHKIN